MTDWIKFDSGYSSIDITQANTENVSLKFDWLRESKHSRMKINGIPIIEYAKKYNRFEETSDVESFFKEVILKDMTSVDENKKSQITDFLKKTFHQGGYMYPVSASLAVSMKEYSEKDKMDDFYATIGKAELSLNIVTTKNGFKLQEFTKIKELQILSPTLIEKFDLDPGCPRLYPENNADYVIKAQGTLNFDFSKKC